jgi:glycosyltransferase involved in cell wall biosynthesis
MAPPTPGDPAAKWTGDFEKKVAIWEKYLRPLVVSTGPTGIHRVGDTEVLAFPALRPAFLGGVLFYSAATLVAQLWAIRNSAQVIVCQSPFEGFGALLYRKMIPKGRRALVQVEVHGDWRTAPRLYGSQGRRLLAPITDRIACWALRRADRVRVVSDWLGTLVREAGYDGSMDTYLTYTDFSQFTDPPVKPLPTMPCVIYVGVLQRYKGVDVLLRAWRDVARDIPDAQLTIVGDGPRRRELQRIVVNLGIGANVSFQEAVPRSVLSRAIDASCLLVLPSRSEGLGRVVPEAMARARPVVGSNVGGIPEAIEDGVTGVLVPSENVEALAATLSGLLGDRARLEAMGSAARERIQDRQPATEFDAGSARLAAWAAGDDT